MTWRDRLALTQRLPRLLKHCATEDSDEKRAELARHACVLASGYVEVCCRDIISSQASPAVCRYIQSQLQFFQNPNMENILQLIGSFDPGLRANVEDSLDPRHKDAIDSIVANKNSIAHGRNVGISYVHIKNYIEAANDTIKIIEDRLLAS